MASQFLKFHPLSFPFCKSPKGVFKPPLFSARFSSLVRFVWQSTKRLQVCVSAREWIKVKPGLRLSASSSWYSCSSELLPVFYVLDSFRDAFWFAWVFFLLTYKWGKLRKCVIFFCRSKLNQIEWSGESLFRWDYFFSFVWTWQRDIVENAALFLM